MKKIPVRATIRNAYAFAFGHLAAIVAIAWLPLALLLAGEYLAVRHYFESVLKALAEGNQFAIYGAAGLFYLYRVIALLLLAMIAVPIMRQALGERNRADFAYFALGRPQLRAFGALISVELIMLTLEVLSFIGWWVILLTLSSAAKSAGPIAGIAFVIWARWTLVVITLALLAAIVFINVRLSFLLMPVTVSEQRIDLIRGWTLTEGNFLRSLVVLFAIAAPIWVLFVALQFALAGFAVYDDASTLFFPANRFSADRMEAATQMQAVLAWLPLFFGAWLMVRPFALGLAAGAGAASYRALVSGRADVSIPAAASPSA